MINDSNHVARKKEPIPIAAVGIFTISIFAIFEVSSVIFSSDTEIMSCAISPPLKKNAATYTAPERLLEKNAEKSTSETGDGL
jgi:hypothetical protein